MKTIRLPKLLTVGWSNMLLSLCGDALEYKGPVTFDFERVEWAAPFGLTAVSVTLAKCLRQGKTLYYTAPAKPDIREYLERIGFKHHFLRGKAVPHRKTSLELQHLRGADPNCSEKLAELIGENLNLSDDAVYEMRTHLNELMTNGFDHSRSPVGCYVCAQWYPAKRNLRISFADGGIGILSALKTSAEYSGLETHEEAIRLAVRRGVTSRKGRVGGFGLDYMRGYVRNNEGTLTIITGNSKVNFFSNKIEAKPQPVRYPGTIVDIKVSPRRRRALARGKYDLF